MKTFTKAELIEHLQTSGKWLPGVEIEEIDGPWTEDRRARMEQDCAPAY